MANFYVCLSASDLCSVDPSARVWSIILSISNSFTWSSLSLTISCSCSMIISFTLWLCKLSSSYYSRLATRLNKESTFVSSILVQNYCYFYDLISKSERFSLSLSSWYGWAKVGVSGTGPGTALGRAELRLLGFLYDGILGLFELYLGVWDDCVFKLS